MEADHDEVAEQVGVDVLGATAHMFLLKSADPRGDGRFDFALCFHCDLGRVPIPGEWLRATTNAAEKPLFGCQVHHTWGEVEFLLHSALQSRTMTLEIV